MNGLTQTFRSQETFICEAHQILQAAREQTKPHLDPEGRREVPHGHADNPSAADPTPTAN
jgi:hypothetical protein